MMLFRHTVTCFPCIKCLRSKQNPFFYSDFLVLMCHKKYFCIGVGIPTLLCSSQLDSGCFVYPPTCGSTQALNYYWFRTEHGPPLAVLTPLSNDGHSGRLRALGRCSAMYCGGDPLLGGGDRRRQFLLHCHGNASDTVRCLLLFVPVRLPLLFVPVRLPRAHDCCAGAASRHSPRLWFGVCLWGSYQRK